MRFSDGAIAGSRATFASANWMIGAAATFSALVGGPGSAVGESVADETVQADAFLGGGEGQFPVEGLGDADVELARESSFGDGFWNGLAVRLEVRNDVGDEIDQAAERLGLVEVKPGERGELCDRGDVFAVLGGPQDSVGVVLDVGHF